jgi:hypothetical protein
MTLTVAKMIYNIPMSDKTFNLVAGTKTTHPGLHSVMSRTDSNKTKSNMIMDRISIKTNPKINLWFSHRIMLVMVARRKSCKINWSKCL